MTIDVNNQTQSIVENSTITMMLEQLNFGSNGIAIAINNEIISKENWDQKTLNNNDQLTIIKATQGG